MQKSYEALFPGVRVLLVEDYTLNRELTTDILHHMGCVVDSAVTGLDALDQYKKKEYDLILLDILIPHKNGLEVAQEIREMEGTKKHTLIIALTASLSVNGKEICAKAGIDEYLSKPLQKDKLVAYIQQHLKK